MTRKTHILSIDRSASHRSAAGFTLLELIVSLGVAAVMFLMIDRIFYETQRAVTAGIKTGEIMVKAETIGDQLQRDAEIMVGPGGSGPARGCLIIGQKLYTNVPLLDANFSIGPGYVAPTSGPAGRREDIRSDQIVFFIDGGGRKIASLTPKDQSTLAATRHFQYGRVWYGHTMVTKPDGTLGSGTFGTVDNAENLYANRWVLGRQNLLFRDDDTYIPSGSDIYGSYTISGSDIKPSTTVNVNPYIGSPLYMAQTDVCFQKLETVWDNIVTYPSEPLGFSYLDNRLWVNRALTGGQQPGARAFTSAGMSQLHPLLSGNISDFIVEFAGDYDGDNAIDTDSGNIKWYGFWFNNLANGQRDRTNFPVNIYGPTVAYDPTQPTVFAPPAGQFDTTGAATAAAPNEAYYLGSAATAAANADAVFVFRHDDTVAGTNKWPYLLRVRYRLHDDNGVIASTTDAGRTMGKWYEHIIRVPRP